MLAGARAFAARNSDGKSRSTVSWWISIAMPRSSSSNSTPSSMHGSRTMTPGGPKFSNTWACALCTLQTRKSRMMSNPYWRGFARKFGCLSTEARFTSARAPSPDGRGERAGGKAAVMTSGSSMSSFAVTDAAPPVIARRCAVLAGKRRSLPRRSCDLRGPLLRPADDAGLRARLFDFSGRCEPFVVDCDRRIGVAMLWAGTLSDAFGRKAVMTVWATTPSAATLATSFSPDWTTSVTHRALTGLALSGIPAAANAYLAEEMDRSAARRASRGDPHAF
jgi:hypothetical protein